MKRLLVIGVVAAAALSATGAIAFAAGTGSSDPNHSQSARPQVRQIPAAAIDTAVESKFTAIAPCRTVDTRNTGGKFANGAQRTYTLTNCSIPSAASAVAATITTVATHSGYLKAWANGATEPATSFMNYGTSFNASTGGVIPVNASKINVKNHAGPTYVIIDITGYYITPLRANVSPSGTLLTGSSRATAAHQPFGTGTYEVDFDRNVVDCTYNATAQFGGNEVIAEPRSGVSNGVYLQISNSSGTAADVQFYLTVTC